MTEPDVLAKTPCYIDGTWESGAGDLFTSVNPADRSTTATWALADEEQGRRAVAAARRSFDAGGWRGLEPSARAQVLRRLADRMAENHEELAQLVITEVGSPITLARGLQTATPILNVRWWADEAERGPRGGYVEELHEFDELSASRSVLVRQPVGVVSAITPYNYPIQMITWKVVPALAAGCSAVLMPAPRGALAAVRFTQLAEEAGIPPGVLNLVPGSPGVGQLICSHPDVDMVTFTGSNAVGASVMQAAAATSKKVVLELGGKSPTVLLPGVDLRSAVPPTILRFSRNAGQGCGATTRILVHRDDHDEFVRSATAFIRDELVMGNPRREDVEVGPVISAEHRERVEGYLARAVQDGGTIAVGGGRPPGSDGFYLEPTLVTGLSPDAELCQDELFAPVAVVLPYEDVDDAVHIANDSRYGLNAAVWGEPALAQDVALRLRSGTVAVNGGGGQRPDAPWVGTRQSGVGCEMGEDGFTEFFDLKHVQTATPLSNS